MTDMTRNEFLRGALASFGAVGARSLFAMPLGWKPQGKPAFTFGVVADTHLRTSPRNGSVIDKDWKGTYFESALRHFKSRNIDAVVHCGDFAHLGQVVEMEAHAAIWSKVFPENKGNDGREVAKLFVTGNHEFCSHVGGNRGAFVRRLYPEQDRWNDAVLQVDTAQKWRRIWGEEYSETWHREVGGFHFFGWQFRADLKKTVALLEECIEKHGLEGSEKPMFFIGHVPQGRPRAIVEVLRRHGCRNAVAFYGHNHYSAANMNTFVNASDTFTFINAPCCAPWYGAVLLHDEGISAAGKIEGREQAQTPPARQGLVVSLYDGMMVVERHDFGNGAKLCPDLMLPLEKREEHPWSWKALKRTSGVPQFKKNVELKIESVKLESGGDAVRVSIPLADGNPDSRVYAYEVEVAGDEGAAKLHKAVYAAGCNMGIGHEPNKGVTTLEIPKSELPTGKTLTIAVRPLTSLGTSGKPIVAEFKV